MRKPADPSFDHVYLGEQVKVVDRFADGWVLTEWQDGRRWRQWGAQVRPQLAVKTLSELTAPKPNPRSV